MSGRSPRTRRPAGHYLVDTRPTRARATSTDGPFVWPDQTVAVERLVWQLCHFWLAPLRRWSGMVSRLRRDA